MFNLEKMEGSVNPNQAVVSSSEVVVGNKGFWDSLVGVSTSSESKENNTVSYYDPPSSMADKKRTLEFRYARFLMIEGKFRALSEGSSRTLYKWENCCWERVGDEEAERMAWKWLVANAPGSAKQSAAASLHQSSLLELFPLPHRPEDTVIPLANLWLNITEDNKLQIQKPDSRKGVAYHIKAKLDFSEGAEFYEPKPIPEDSLFYKFLAVSLPNKSEQNLVQEFCGYTLLNDVRFQKAQVWVGDGCNGKSVLLKIISTLHQKVGSICLDGLKGFGLSPLVDSSLLVSAETPKRGINEQELKKIISGDPLTVEYKFKDMFTYSPTGKLLIACNRFPQVNDDSEGVWRRLQIVRWGVNLSKAQQITNLDSKIIKSELNIVVDWCLEGLLRLLKRGDFDEPESVLQRKNNEKLNSNNVLAFAEDYGIHESSENETIAKEIIYKKYSDYTEANGLAGFQANEFWKRMKQLFPNMIEKKKTGNARRIRVVNLAIGDFSEDITTDFNPFNEVEGGQK